MDTKLQPKPTSPSVKNPEKIKSQVDPKDSAIEGIIERKTASATSDNNSESKETPTVVNITIDTKEIALLIEKQNVANVETNKKIEQSIEAMSERIDRLAATPTKVATPDDLEREKTDNPRHIYIAQSQIPIDAKTAFTQFNEIYDLALNTEFDAGRGYGRMTARDIRQIDRYVAQNRQILQQAFQEEGYKNGLFRAAATTLADIPASFSGYLSSIMRQTPKWGKVWWQFLNPVIRLGTGVGNTVDVPRMGKINRPITSTNWTLSGNGFATTSQNLTNGYERVTIGRYGMGEPGQANDPVGVDEYLFRHSIIDLEAQIQDVLGENLNEFREIITYEQYAGTPLIRYYKDSTATIETVATALTAADTARISYAALVRLRAHMNGDIGVIPWPDGNYILIAHPKAIVDLEIELTQMAKPISRMDIEEVTNMISQVNTAMIDRISGYRFTVGGFHIFTHENLPPDPNFMLSSTTAPARNWYDNIAFGPMAVCECISMAPEIRRHEMREFGTMNRYIWLMYGKYQAIERGTGPTGLGIGQRTQIVKFRSGRA